jgi:hypothetical protein
LPIPLMPWTVAVATEYGFKSQDESKVSLKR